MLKEIEDNIINRSDLIFIIIVIGLIFMSFNNFLLFHSLVELFSIITAAIIFIIAVYSHSKTTNNFLLILGIAYGFIGGFDLVHTLVYKGMGIFETGGSNLATQLWMIARYMESVSIVISFLFINKIKKYNYKKIIYLYSVISLLILLTLYFKVFPTCYIEGEGLTLFKIISEYIISGILIYGLFLLYKNRDYFKNNIYNLIFVSIILTILSEISFTFYISVFGISNIVGHIFKLLSVILIFKAIVETGFKRPYDLLFREVEIKNKELEDKTVKLQEQNNFLSITLYSIGDAVIVTDKEGTIERLNKRAQELTQWDIEEAQGEYITEVFHIVNVKTRKTVDNPVKKVLEKGKTVGLANHTKLIAKDGTEYHIADSAAPIKDENGELLGAILVFRDVTEQYDAKRKVKEKNKWLSALYENATDPIVTLDTDHHILDINNAFQKIFSYRREKIQGKNLDDVLNRGKENSADRDLTKRLLKGQKVQTEGTRYDKEGKAIECLIKGIPVKVDNALVGAYVIYNDITERKKREEKMEYLSYKDQLTNLYNRTFLEAEIKRLDVKRQLPISMIMLDLNGLKIINDTYGHKAGDKLLKKTAEVLKDIFRDEDIIARWGGDEFVILLNRTAEKVTMKLINRIKNIKKGVELSENISIPLSIAVGYAVKKDESIRVSTLFRKAEDRMYKDKLLERKSKKSHLIESLLATLKENSSETEKHAKRMEKVAHKLGKKIGLGKFELNRLSLLARLHDIGKVGIALEILNKPDKLSDTEWEEIKKHPGIGYRICSGVEEFSHVAEEILAHHEFWNGEGYPENLKKDEIPLLSRIISIVDAYDVMTHDRPYSKAISKQEALKEIKRCAGSQFDPKLAEEFVKMMSK